MVVNVNNITPSHNDFLSSYNSSISFCFSPAINNISTEPKIANGSTFELITQLILAKRLNLIKEETIQPIISQLVEVSNINFSFQKTLKTT